MVCEGEGGKGEVHIRRARCFSAPVDFGKFIAV